jgi:glycosyltransferase involved in cell wall biosynthesis
MEPLRIAAIVPAYNEAKTVGGVVRALAASDVFDEVIVVSDGSTDRTRRAALDAGADLVHELPINGGKGRALLHGVAHTDAEVVAFFDADLGGLTAAHIRALVDPVAEGRVDMCVGLRDRGTVITALMKHALPLVSGQRALRRDVADRVPAKFMRGFGSEVALNAYCAANRLRIDRVPLAGLTNVRKDQKVGFFRALWQYAGMWRQVFVTWFATRMAQKELRNYAAHAEHDHV